MSRRVGRLLALAFLVTPVAVDGATVVLDADRAAARLLEVSPVAKAAAARLEGAEASVDAAGALRWPSLQLSASAAERSSVPEFRLPIAAPGSEAPLLAPNITTVWAAGIRLQQPLWAGGAIDAHRRASEDELLSIEARRRQVRSELILTAKESYWEAVRSAAAVLVAQRQKSRAERLLEDTRELVDAGMAVRADRLAAEERFASAKLVLLRSETAKTRAVAELRSLLRYPFEVALDLTDSIAPSLPAPVANLDELLSEANRNRSELLASEAQIDGFAARESLAASSGRPALSLVGVWDYARPNSRYFPLQDEAHDSWSVGLVGSWTLFDGGRSRAEKIAAEAAGRAAREDRDELLRRIALEVETRRLLLESTRGEVTAAEAAQASAEARLEAARERREAGLAPISEVLDAESALAAAEYARLEARASSWLAAARLDRALGR